MNLILLPDALKSVKGKNFFSSFRDSSVIIYKREGVGGFFRGLSPAVIRSVTAAGIFFYSLDNIDNFLQQHISNLTVVDFIASATSRTLSSVLTNPFTVMKTRAGIVGNNTYSSVWRNFGLIYRQEGMQGFFKGSFVMILRDFPFGGIFYLTYNFSNKILMRVSDNSLMYFISGMIAGVTATTLTQPLEIVKAQKQANTQRIVAGQNSISISQSLKNIYKEDGFHGFTRGLFPRLLRKPIINAATFFFYEVFSKVSAEKNKVK